MENGDLGVYEKQLPVLAEYLYRYPIPYTLPIRGSFHMAARHYVGHFRDSRWNDLNIWLAFIRSMGGRGKRQPFDEYMLAIQNVYGEKKTVASKIWFKIMALVK